jgi:hypothetical protein
LPRTAQIKQQQFEPQPKAEPQTTRHFIINFKPGGIQKGRPERLNMLRQYHVQVESNLIMEDAKISVSDHLMLVRSPMNVTAKYLAESLGCDISQVEEVRF